EIGGRTIRLIERYELPAGRVAFDAGGGGKQIADRLHEQGHRVQIVGFGESAEAKLAYRNRRAELYGKLRELLNPDREGGVFALPPQAGHLRRELAVLPLQYDSEGRMQLPPKNASSPQGPSLRQLLGRSPDRADSLVLAVWGLSRPRPRIPVYEGPIAYIPDRRPRRPLTEEELNEFPEPFRGIIEMYQHPRYRQRWQD
ncbi:unnamed protein product, partial [marine sediment metagenome]